MMLINGTKLKKDITGNLNQCIMTDDFYKGAMFVLKIVRKAERVEAEPVRHGHWEIAIGYDPKRKFQCSECFKMAFENSKYCPACGSRMDEVCDAEN